ncbi:nucleoside-triphosphatase [Amedibacillus dolichus]|uniref:nucleoside-triphosphatase n=1 Tax=Amedibacillus dolichus TaxID=31971 RepID=UPI001D0325A2|nr:nucleoside-triphosphatase [Amedibacillus dolichus]MCB5373361.1 nucleoside-triphosphatase [Amedibacillus dolichus]
MKIFLTGEKGVGKSTCIQEIIKECQISVCGFMTLPFYEENKRVGFMLHALVDREFNDVRFSKQKEVIPNVFNSFGVEVLKECLHYRNRFLILDEIGFLEQNETAYLAQLKENIDAFNNIIGVLRKCDIQYIVEIKKRKDVLLLDFDKLSKNEVKTLLKMYVEDSL